MKRFSEPHHLLARLGSPIDIHQHLWPEPLLRALAQRREPPMLLRTGARLDAAAASASPRRPSTSPTTTPTAARRSRPPTASTAC